MTETIIRVNDDTAPRWAVEMAQAVGRVEGKVDSFHDAFQKHVQDTDAVELRVSAVEKRQAKQRGAMGVWTLVTSTVGSAVGLVVGYFSEHGHFFK